MNPFQKFRSIENFVSLHHDVKKRIFVTDRPVMTYRGKIKLHGTNAGITVNVEGVFPSKRTAFVSIGDDNFGFASWVNTRGGIFRGVRQALRSPDEITIFGEWAGPGISGSDAVNNIPEKEFFVFAIRNGNFWITDPSALRLLIGDHQGIHIIPWSTSHILCDFSSSVAVEKFVEQVNHLIEPLNKTDPYINDLYNIDLPGEGMVFYPQAEWGGDIEDSMMNYIFKAKVEHHQMSGNKNKPAEVDPILHDNAALFAAEFVTDARINQGLTEAGISLANATPKDTGALLKWVCVDVMKESVAHLEAAGMTWKQVAKAVADKARHSFFILLENRLKNVD